jgi:tetratricopeptide (TPR) repeat protein
MSHSFDDLYEEALYLLNQQNVTDAKKCLANMVSLAPKDARTLEIAGDCAKEEHDYDKAIECYKEILVIGDSHEVGRGHLSLGYLYVGMEKRPEAIESLNRAIPLLGDSDRLYDLLQASVTIGEIQYDLGQFESSAETFHEILEKYEDVELDEDCSLVYLSCARQFADALRCLGKLEDALEQYESVAAICEELEIMDEFANALDGIGVVHQIQGKFSEAEKYHQRSLNINQSEDEHFGIVANLANLARVHIHMEDWDLARQYANRLLRLETDEESTEGVGFAKLLLAECDIGTQNYEAADKVLQSLLKLFSHTGQADDYVNAISVLGYLRRLQGNLTESERLQNESLEISLKMKNKDFLLSIYDELAEIRVAQKRYSDAHDFWQTALNIAQELKSAKMLKRIKKRIAEI